MPHRDHEAVIGLDLSAGRSIAASVRQRAP
jgi:hypothetical protein